jgi:cell pole-organizing protein PopZ
MGVVANEPSMEDILSSIKRIIADGSDRPQAPKGARRRPAAVADGAPDEPGPAANGDEAEEESAVLELTDALGEEDNAPPAAESAPAMPAPIAPATATPAPVEPESPPAAPPAVQVSFGAETPLDPGIISDRSAQAARQSLSHLSSLLVRPEEGESNTLEGLVREMLKPMLKQWLDERLPEMVEVMVKKEIDRITGRLG